MIRGINRQIIEVCDTGNQYFERALLFVRPEYASVDHKMLKAQAQNIIRGYIPPYRRQKPQQKKRDAVLVCGILAVAAVAVVLILKLL